MKKVFTYYEKHSTPINIVLAILSVIGFVFIFIPPSRNSGPKLMIVPDDNIRPIVTMNKKIKDLTVTYKDLDLNQSHLNLSVVPVKIINKGTEPIREADYDRTPFCLRIYNCKIIGVDIPKNNKNKNVRLTSGLNPRIKDSITIEFDKLMYNPGEEVLFNVYYLSNNKRLNDYYVFGNIAGQKAIPIYFKGELEPAFGISDDVKDFLYFLLFMSLLISIEIPLLNYFAKMKRRREIRRRTEEIQKLFKYPYKKDQLNDAQIAFIEIYAGFGKEDFIELLEGLIIGDQFIQKEEKFIAAYELINEKRTKKHLFTRKLKLVHYNSPYAIAKEKFEESGLVKKNEAGMYFITDILKNESENTLKLFKS